MNQKVTVRWFETYCVQQLADFRKFWRSKMDINPDSFPEVLEPEEWWDQFTAWLEIERQNAVNGLKIQHENHENKELPVL